MYGYDYTYGMMNGYNSPYGMMYGYSPFGGWIWVLPIYVVMALVIQKFAERTKNGPSWWAWVPVLNIILLLRIVKKPDWWTILFFIPVVNLVMAVIVSMAACERFGLNKWWGLVAFISPANMVLYVYLAWGTKKVVEPSVAPAAPKPPSKRPPAPPAA